MSTLKHSSASALASVKRSAMNTLVILPLLVAASLAAPVADPAADCDNKGNIAVAAPYALPGYPAAFPLQAAAFPAPVQTRIEYQAPAAPVVVPAPFETRIHYADTPVISGYSAQIVKPALGAASFALPAAAPLPLVAAQKADIEVPAPAAFAPQFTYAAAAAPQLVLAEKTNVEYTVPAPAPVAFAPQFTYSAAAAAAPVAVQKTEVQYAVPAAPAPVAFAAPQFAVAAPVETRVHYAETPVVSGYSAQIIKPAIGAAAAAPFPAMAYSGFAAPAAGFAAAAPAQAALNLGPQIPAGDAPAPEELVQTEKVLAPVRQVSKITQQFDVHLPAKVNVERVPHDINVPVPVPQPVPVPVAPAIHAAVHHAPIAAAYAAVPAFAAHTLTVASPSAEVPCDN